MVTIKSAGIMMYLILDNERTIRPKLNNEQKKVTAHSAYTDLLYRRAVLLGEIG